MPPADVAGTVDVVVTSGGETQRFPAAFTYLEPATDVPPADADGDTLPDVWETQFGLDAFSASGDDGASGDADQDGRTNVQEWQSGSHPSAVFTRFFAEGATAPLFEAEFAVANVEARAATVLLRLQRSDGSERAHLLQVPPMASRSVRAGALPDMASREFSTVVESDVPVVVDRLMTWDRSAGTARTPRPPSRRQLLDVVPGRGRHALRVRPVLPAAEPEHAGGARAHRGTCGRRRRLRWNGS